MRFAQPLTKKIYRKKNVEKKLKYLTSQRLVFKFEGLGDNDEELIGDEADEERDGDDAKFGMLVKHLLILCLSDDAWLFEELEEVELELRLFEPCSFC